MRHQSAPWFWAVLASLLVAGSAPAGWVRYHYVPVDARGTARLQPIGAGAGERMRWLGAVREPAGDPPRATHVVTYRHPHSGQNIAVPIAFPDGTPQIERVRQRLIYNYGSDTIELRFQADGSVDLIYSSGLFRAP